MAPAEVRIETLAYSASPYRGTARDVTLRLIVSIAPRGMLPLEVTIDVDDACV
jgi:hypothetical protein